MEGVDSERCQVNKSERTSDELFIVPIVFVYMCMSQLLFS